ncbi:cobalt-precorrin-6A reductase [Pseudoruegeria sp. HB172150]|uniref:cobalt-precorrin-6A reductase n=1 Tax=Pseudoruegeria sp. HB172150 TaxID=2721164 RepID=UPI00155169B3|nr:cobalt-precorrin-6A reductase [Pseudoruegeria sp. HB172150]
MRLLLLAGTREGRRIGRALSKKGLDAMASLAGGTHAPADLGLPTRVGGFGGREAFRNFLRKNQISAVLDATHPFAVRISHRTAAICGEESVAYAQVLRPGWVPQAGDTWVFCDCEEDAVALVPEGATVFLGTGPAGLDRYAGLQGQRVICRRIDSPTSPFPFAGGEYLVGRPPFSVADEVALFTRLSVDVLVVKNSGGDASRSKLDAARKLGIKVILLNRPEQPEALRFETEEEALDWVKGLTWSDGS